MRGYAYQCEQCRKFAVSPAHEAWAAPPPQGWLVLADSSDHRYDLCSAECLIQFATRTWAEAE